MGIKTQLMTVAVLLALAGAIIYFWNIAAPQKWGFGLNVACTTEAKLCPDGSYVGRTGLNCEFSQCPQADYKNITYMIQGQPVTLLNGRAETAIPGSESKIITQYFGNEAVGDLNGDGAPDVGFLLTQSGGGSGTFYYVVEAIHTPDGGYQGTNAMFLGDRIAPQTTEIHNGQLVVNYADRSPSEPMIARPSIGKSVYVHLDVKNMEIGEAVQNFEGETDISRIIKVTFPLPNQKVTSPLKITGKAVGNWYFEASFPVRIADADGKTIASGPAQAEGDWMTTNLVPFEVTLTFDKPTTATGTLILLKDNPSGLLERDNSISIPVSF